MKKRKKILHQIYPTYLVVTFGSLFVVIWFVFHTLNGLFLDETRRDLTARAELIKHHIKATGLTEPALDAWCKTAGSAAKTRITLVLPSGRVVADSEEDPARMENHTDRTEILQALQTGSGSSLRYSATLKTQMMYVALPMTGENSARLVVRTALPVTSIYSALGGIKFNIFAVALVLALLVALVSLVISRNIALPIREMEQGARRFAGGDLSSKLVLPASAELASLAEAMNDMAGRLDDRIKTAIRQKNELNAVFSSMTEAVIAIGSNEKILRVNHAAETFLRKSRQALNGTFLYEVIRNHDFKKFVESAVKTDRSEADLPFELDGKTHIINIHASALVDETGERMGALLILNDVTRMRQLETMRKDFAANVSHELKTPLTSIQGFTETLLAEPSLLDNAHVVRCLEIIANNTKRLTTIIDDLLKLSEIEHADRQKDFNFQEAPLADVINSAAAICRPDLDSKQIKLESDCPADLALPIDPFLLELALVNLVENAVKYSPNNSEVGISAEDKGREVHVSVIDHGTGIAEAHIPRIFERFYRVDKARSRELGGTGLGLAIVKHVAQIHGGRIEVQSTPGKGSAFTLIFPRPM
ncbi:sensor histidine kinase [Desulfosudis oleivorans]|uniref:histidine kinase n=1 Tax=Desulfosudis oleivorans (strain DSM 6200 / JCM 39069 / Hxd3) TaxID=96561 RepID=A8ZSJ8_DESOH|nr:ATP-binding protein [Desulfosudis oleivorans]ABW67735.1 PAS/PAC sensor signal transduction histidine kinase [Desulfosudis oleivorans Hxd3]